MPPRLNNILLGIILLLGQASAFSWTIQVLDNNDSFMTGLGTYTTADALIQGLKGHLHPAMPPSSKDSKKKKKDAEKVKIGLPKALYAAVVDDPEFQAPTSVAGYDGIRIFETTSRIVKYNHLDAIVANVVNKIFGVDDAERGPLFDYIRGFKLEIDPEKSFIFTFYFNHTEDPNSVRLLQELLLFGVDFNSCLPNSEQETRMKLRELYNLLQERLFDIAQDGLIPVELSDSSQTGTKNENEKAAALADPSSGSSKKKKKNNKKKGKNSGNNNSNTVNGDNNQSLDLEDNPDNGQSIEEETIMSGSKTDLDLQASTEVVEAKVDEIIEDEAEKARQQAEEAAKAEMARLQAEEEARKLAEEVKKAEEAREQAEIRKMAQEHAASVAVEKARLKAEREEAKKRVEEAKKAEKARLQAAAKAKKLAEKEARKQAEEAKKAEMARLQAEAARKQAEEARKQAEAARKQAQEEKARLMMEEEKKKKEEEEARKLAIVTYQSAHSVSNDIDLLFTPYDNQFGGNGDDDTFNDETFGDGWNDSSKVAGLPAFFQGQPAQPSSPHGPPPGLSIGSSSLSSQASPYPSLSSTSHRSFSPHELGFDSPSTVTGPAVSFSSTFGSPMYDQQQQSTFGSPMYGQQQQSTFGSPMYGQQQQSTFGSPMYGQQQQQQQPLTTVSNNPHPGSWNSNYWNGPFEQSQFGPVAQQRTPPKVSESLFYEEPNYAEHSLSSPDDSLRRIFPGLFSSKKVAESSEQPSSIPTQPVVPGWNSSNDYSDLSLNRHHDAPRDTTMPWMYGPSETKPQTLPPPSSSRLNPFAPSYSPPYSLSYPPHLPLPNQNRPYPIGFAANSVGAPQPGQPWYQGMPPTPQGMRQAPHAPHPGQYGYQQPFGGAQNAPTNPPYF